MRRLLAAFLALTIVLAPTNASAQNPDQLLLSAAFSARSKAVALAQVESALKGAEAALARQPGNREAQLQRAIAIGYRAKLRRNPGDAKAARREFERLVAADSRDPEAQIALGGWHLLAIVELGALLARTVVGARKAVGMQHMQRALAMSGGRALFPAYASLILIQLDPGDVAGARRLADAAVKGRAPTAFDRVMQRNAAALLTPLRAGNGEAAAALAAKLMPFGRLEK